MDKQSAVEDILKAFRELTPEEKLQVREGMGEPVGMQPKGEQDLAQAPVQPGAMAMPGRDHVLHIGQNARLSNFSGEKGKDASYALWRFEIRGMQRDGLYSDSQMLHAITRSLHGKASETLVHMGEEVSVDRILSKFDKMFGNILPTETALEQFYSARQTGSETVADWACRMEELLLQAQLKDSFPAETQANMQRTKFYSGLKTGTVKSALRHKYDGGATYEDLLVAARVAEMEEATDKKTSVNQVTTVEAVSAGELDKFLKGMTAMQSRIEALEKEMKRSQKQAAQKQSGGGTAQWQQQSQPHQSGVSWTRAAQQNLETGQQAGQLGRPLRFSGRCFQCNKYGHRIADCPLNLRQPSSRDGC